MARSILHLSSAPEDRFLLFCMRRRLYQEQRPSINQLVHQNFDWNRVARVARMNRVVWRLSPALEQLDDGTVPSALRRELDEVNDEAILRNDCYDKALASILTVCHHERVPVMLLKGAALSRILGGRNHARPQSDIDILIHEGDFREVRHILSGEGYALSRSVPELVGRGIVEYAHCFDQIKFYRAAEEKIDLHFRLINMGIPRTSEEKVWSRALPVRSGEVEALVPSPEDMLLHLCFHANHHCFDILRFFCDIADVIEHYENLIDWAYLRAAAAERRMCATVYYGLLLTHQLLHVPVPPAALESLKPNCMKRALFKFVWLYGIGNAMDRLRIDSAEGPLYYVLEMDGFMAKAKFIRKVIFPPLMWLSHRYSRRPSSMLYVTHLFELMRGRR